MDKHSNAQDYERHPIQTIAEFKILKTQLKNSWENLTHRMDQDGYIISDSKVK